jgi:hypothetical protein
VSDLSRASRRLAIVLGAVGIGSWVSLVAFFVVEGPFGAINDLGNGALGLLSGILAVLLRRLGVRPKPGDGLLATGAAVVGAVVTLVGSALVLSDSTGFFLAGLVSSSGFALIGLWLVMLGGWRGFPTGGQESLRPSLGVVTGAVMAIGLFSVPGAVMGLDDMDAAPGWVTLGGISWLGTYILLPIWSIRLARVLGGSAEKR